MRLAVALLSPNVQAAKALASEVNAHTTLGGVNIGSAWAVAAEGLSEPGIWVLVVGDSKRLSDALRKAPHPWGGAAGRSHQTRTDPDREHPDYLIAEIAALR